MADGGDGEQPTHVRSPPLLTVAAGGIFFFKGGGGKHRTHSHPPAPHLPHLDRGHRFLQGDGRLLPLCLLLAIMVASTASRPSSS